MAMAREHDIVREDDVIANTAIMGDMRIRKEGAFVADCRDQSAAFCAGIDRDAFADHAIVSDEKLRIFTVELQILRLVPNRRKRKNSGACTNFRFTCKGNMADQVRSIAKLDVRTDHAERSDANITANLRFRIDDGGRMNH
jgi:hypothetical protein